MRRAMQAFSSMNLDVAERCLGIVETAAEFYPGADDAVQKMYLAEGTTTAPVSGAMSMLAAIRPERRTDLN